jgi:hypothetical protein
LPELSIVTPEEHHLFKNEVASKPKEEPCWSIGRLSSGEKVNCESMAESSLVDGSMAGNTKREEVVPGDIESADESPWLEAVGEVGEASILTLSLYSISIRARSLILNVSQFKSIP